jgi:hypothetical protein
LWCHLYEFKNIEQLKDFFIPIFEFADKKRKEGSLEIETMQSIVAKINNGQR